MIPLTLSGPPRHRGRAHGEAFRERIAGAIDAWFGHLSERIEPQDFVADLCHRSGLRTGVERHAPDLLQEVEGIAEASRQPIETMLAWQFVDESWWYLDEWRAAPPQPHERCSAVAVNHAGTGIVAQTMDLPWHFDGTQIMLRYLDDSGLEILAPSVAGLLALNGVNSAGLAVAITGVSQLAHGTGGVSSGFILPMLLRCRTVDEALALLDRTPGASGDSYTLGTRDRSTVVEVSADGMGIVHDGDRALHTNHPLKLAPMVERRLESSENRLDQLERTVRPDATVDEIAAMFAGGPICKNRNNDGLVVTAATMIFELGDDPICHFASGPLDSEELVSYGFRSGA